MSTYAVVHLIHVRTPHKHIARLFVTNVPDDVTVADVQDRLTEAGYDFGEFGIAWANHYVEKLTDAGPQVKGAWNRGDVETITWGALEFSYDDPEPSFKTAADGTLVPRWADEGGDQVTVHTDEPICLGYVQVDRVGDVGPGDRCAGCGETLNDLPWLAVMGDGTLHGPLCALCATSE